MPPGRPSSSNRPSGSAKVAALAVVERLFREAEIASAPPADLDHDERRRRTRVDRHEVELVATDMDVPGEDGPARLGQPRTDESLRGVARDLRRRSCLSSAWAVHGRMVPADPHPRLTAG